MTTLYKEQYHEHYGIVNPHPIDQKHHQKGLHYGAGDDAPKIVEPTGAAPKVVNLMEAEAAFEELKNAGVEVYMTPPYEDYQIQDLWVDASGKFHVKYGTKSGYENSLVVEHDQGISKLIIAGINATKESKPKAQPKSKKVTSV